jgi:hypothetical protein
MPTIGKVNVQIGSQPINVQVGPSQPQAVSVAYGIQEAVNANTGTFGNSSIIPVITVDSFGRITRVNTASVASVSNVDYNATTGNLVISTSSGTNYTVDIGVGRSDNPTFASVNAGYFMVNSTTVIDNEGYIVVGQLRNSGVTAGTYGSSTQIPVVSVDVRGRVVGLLTVNVDTLTAQSAFNQANTANVLAQSAFNKANAANVLAQAAFDTANTAQVNAVFAQNVNSYQNNIITIVQGGLNTANANISTLFGIDTAQNNSINLLQGGLNTANANTVFLQGGLNTANANTVFLQGGLNTANANIVFLQGGLNTANANTVFLRGALNTANANTVFLQGGLNTANANTVFLQGGLNTANANTIYLSGVNDSQNTTIGTKFNSSGGIISGSVTIQQNLSVSGNVTVTGNVVYTGNVTSVTISGNTGQFFGYPANGFNALYAGTPTGYLIEPQTVFQLSSNYDGYSGLNMQNVNTGPNASFDLFITADNGTLVDGYLDLGFASSTYNYSGYSLIGKNDGYLYASGNTITGGGNMIIATEKNNDIIFATGGLNTSNVIMSITAANTVLVKSVLPSTSKTTGALQVAGGLGVSGNVYAGDVYSNNTLLIKSVTGNTNQLTANVNLGNVFIGLANVNSNIGTYGGSSQIPVLTLDGYGRVIYSSNVAVNIPAGTTIYANTGQLTANASTGNVALGLANVNSNIGTFGGAAAIPVINLDGYGRVTSVSNVTVNIPVATTITVLDDISNRFDGIERSFGLYSDGYAANVTAPEQLLVHVGGIVLPPFINIYDVVFGSGFIAFTKGYNLANVSNVTYITFASAPQINMDCVMRIMGPNQTPQVKKYPLSPISIMTGY